MSAPEDSYFKLVDVSPDPDDERWSVLRSEIARGVIPETLAPLERTFDCVRSRGCRTVLIERRYTDLDFRSEYSSYWSRLHQERRQFTRRLHFFASDVAAEDVADLSDHRDSYLGYAVLRPSSLGVLGRTMIVPPAEVEGARMTCVRDVPSVFGIDLPVEGVPFAQQDGELLSCGHVAAWLCHYVAHLRGISPRRVTGDIARLPPAQMSPHRALPSSGLSLEQMQALFGALGLPALLYETGALPEAVGNKDNAENLRAVVCKYLTSGYPILVSSADHAFVLIGWISDGESLRFIACDDQVGPYAVVGEDALLEDESSWDALMIPLPPKVYLSGEGAERSAFSNLEIATEEAGREKAEPPPEAVQVVEGLMESKRPISVRSHLLDSRTYKAHLFEQGRDPRTVPPLRLAPLPHFVWVVEFQERAARDANEPCVIAEFVLDTTSHDSLPLICAVSLRGGTSITAPISPVGQPRLERQNVPADGRAWHSLTPITHHRFSRGRPVAPLLKLDQLPPA